MHVYRARQRPGIVSRPFRGLAVEVEERREAGLRPADRYPDLFLSATQQTPVGGIVGPVRSPEQGFIVGDKLTIADLAIATHFVNLGHGGEHIDTARWPKSAAYVQRILAWPSIAQSVEQEKAFITKILSR